MSRHLWNWELIPMNAVSIYRDLIGLLEQAEMHLRKADELCTWLPTAENINALSEPVKDYIYHLETMADPAGMVAENVLLKDQTRQLDAMIARLKRRGSTDG